MRSRNSEPDSRVSLFRGRVCISCQRRSAIGDWRAILLHWGELGSERIKSFQFAAGKISAGQGNCQAFWQRGLRCPCGTGEFSARAVDNELSRALPQLGCSGRDTTDYPESLRLIGQVRLDQGKCGLTRIDRNAPGRMR